MASRRRRRHSPPGNEAAPAAVEHVALREKLIELADPTYRVGSLMAAPTAQVVHGVRTPAVRKVATEWTRANRRRETAEVRGLIASLWNAESRDERALGLEILSQHPDIVADLQRSDFDHWRDDIDNWAIGDFLGYRILGPWMLERPERLSYLEQLIDSGDVWSRRLALTATVCLNRESEQYAERTLALIDRVSEESEPMITKAISWSLRTLVQRHRERVEEYLESRGERLVAHVRREVRNKLKTGRKSGRPVTT